MLKNLLFLSLLPLCLGLSAGQKSTVETLPTGTDFANYKKMHEASVIKESIIHSMNNAPEELQQHISQNPSLADYRYWFAGTDESPANGHFVKLAQGTEYYLYKYNIDEYTSRLLIDGTTAPISYLEIYNHFTNDFNLVKEQAKKDPTVYFPRGTKLLSSALYARFMLSLFSRSRPKKIPDCELISQETINDWKKTGTSHRAISAVLATFIYSIIYKRAHKELTLEEACELLTEEQYIFLRQKNSSHQPYEYDSLRKHFPSWNRYDVLQVMGYSFVAGAVIFGVSTLSHKLELRRKYG